MTISAHYANLSELREFQVCLNKYQVFFMYCTTCFPLILRYQVISWNHDKHVDGMSVPSFACVAMQIIVLLTPTAHVIKDQQGKKNAFDRTTQSSSVCLGLVLQSFKCSFISEHFKDLY